MPNPPFTSRGKWVVQPWFDEGEGVPDESGTPDLIEAESREAALAAFDETKYTSLSDVSVMTPEEWFARGGYPLEGLERP